ncbi:glycosyltransferase family 22 protein [Zasmidium cellare ATCC 36951]|uniref:Mannosyltransferase n=1 Tax=Zasmidium cellare ATCC 36951 TaxID=1080233 RepID=A0A6A6C3M6_ZASCE|nr:glycosyltransferase family 22 protein [Zasmidium cellare ATCC 36951]KAF2160349.1 glycosyltransferase family 22 protein [Zasmidium cellare ATCC 36951]
MATKNTTTPKPTSPSQPPWASHLAIFLGLLIFRIVNAHFVQTFFQPDEYFQALEPAWQMAFGPESGAWITWEWRERLRTSVHPMLFAAAYRAADHICRFLQVSPYVRANALGAAPRILQAFFAASMDYMTWQVGAKVYGRGHAASYATLFLTITSPWQWFCSVRTFSNSLEATLTAASLYYFPWTWFLQPDKEDKKPLSLAGLATFTFDNIDLHTIRYMVSVVPAGLYPALAAAAMAFYIRPTNVIIWVAISAGLVGCNRNYRKAGMLVSAAAIVGVSVVVVFACADYFYYGDWTFPPFRFLYLNLIQSLAVFYGRNRIDYYFTEGLPLLLTTALPFAGLGVWQSLRSEYIATTKEYVERQTRFVFALAATVTVLTFSAIAHKEMRFVYPLLPMLLVLAAGPLAAFLHPFPIPRSKLRQLVLTLMLTSNIYIAGYVSTTHQRGVIDVMHFLRHRQEPWLDAAAEDGLAPVMSPNVIVGFLMPCHSTPWRSHFFYPEIEAWALTCEPPINMNAEERESYLDEADVFYDDPTLWLESNMVDMRWVSADQDADEQRLEGSGLREWPQYLVFFEQLEPSLKAILANTRYKECRRFFNTHWIDDWRRKGDVVVWCQRR